MTDPKAIARARFAEIEPALRKTSRWMYENPEIAYREFEASARLSGLLAGQGFDVTYPAYGLETAFAATAGPEDGHRVVICAEYDALPGVGQACGHNIIATAALGAGIAVASVADDIRVRVTVLGTPAEEHFGGKIDLIEAGAFDGYEAAMMIHPSPHDVVDPNVIAVAHIDIDFFGKTAHASAYPQLGVNALDAAVQAYVNVSTLRQALYPTDKVHGIISEGGKAPNVIPDHTRMSWYVRAQTRTRLEELLPRVIACFEAAAVATGCRVEVEHVGHTYDELVSDPLLVELFTANAAALGRPMKRGVELPGSQSGSTDMGNVSQLVPAIHPMLSIDPGDAVNHQPEFAAHTITPAGEKAIHDGALAMAYTIIDLATTDGWDRLTRPHQGT